MEIMYWDKNSKSYITRESAELVKMRDIERHHYCNKEDLIKGGGLPMPIYEHSNSKFYIGYDDVRYRIINPRDNELNALTLEKWAGEVVVVERGIEKGVIDVNTGELLIPFSEKNKAIYPISKDYFVIVGRDRDYKKIVSRRNNVVDKLYGVYKRNADMGQLFRMVLDDESDERVYKGDGRFSTKALERRENTLDVRSQYVKSIRELKSAGVGLKELNKILMLAYQNKDKTL